jgi:hypothetical protein
MEMNVYPTSGCHVNIGRRRKKKNEKSATRAKSGMNENREKRKK